MTVEEFPKLAPADSAAAPNVRTLLEALGIKVPALAGIRDPRKLH